MRDQNLLWTKEIIAFLVKSVSQTKGHLRNTNAKQRCNLHSDRPTARGEDTKRSINLLSDCITFVVDKTFRELLTALCCENCKERYDEGRRKANLWFKSLNILCILLVKANPKCSCTQLPPCQYPQRKEKILNKYKLSGGQQKLSPTPRRWTSERAASCSTTANNTTDGAHPRVRFGRKEKNDKWKGNR